jgi:hypothetical protein
VLHIRGDHHAKALVRERELVHLPRVSMVIDEEHQRAGRVHGVGWADLLKHLMTPR